jgi:exosortase F-associated protein
MQKWINTIAIIALFVVLAGIRFFETALFYDPLLSFFRSEYHYAQLPEMQLLKLLLHAGLRFWLNTAVSLLILWLAFKDKNVLKFSVVFYFVLFVVLISWMAFLVYNLSETSNFQLLFYVRRFLIQPVFILLLLPAFYYQKNVA